MIEFIYINYDYNRYNLDTSYWIPKLDAQHYFQVKIGRTDIQHSVSTATYTSTTAATCIMADNSSQQSSLKQFLAVSASPHI